jgi:hypothetical protein
MTKPLTLPGSRVHDHRASGTTATDVVLRGSIVGLALATGYIHSTLGGPLFTLNALGYGVAAVAMIVPLGIAIRCRWLIRLGLMAYAGIAIVGWLLIGPRYDVAYLAKAIEVALIALLAIEFARNDTGRIAGLRRATADAVRARPWRYRHDTPH